MRAPVLTDIFIYPLKSARGIRVDEVEVGELGAELDRRWMVVREDGSVVSQRDEPRLSLLEVEVEGDHLRVRGEDREGGPLRVPLGAPTGEEVSVTILKSRVVTRDAGAAAAAWFTGYLGRSVRLVGVASSTVRPVNPRYGPGSRTSLTDGYPFLLVSAESLEELNRRLPSPVGMDRFRPNLIVRGGAPHAEDRWRRFRIGDIPFEVVKPCSRCAATTVDPRRGRRGKEPLRTLSAYRRISGKVFFGQNVVHRGRGSIRVGAPLQIVESGAPKPDLGGAEAVA